MSRGFGLKTLVASVVVAGTLDISDALIFYGLQGVSPGLLLRHIAGGLLGPPALQSGLATAALGLAIHYFITCCWAALFVLLASRIPFLRLQPIISGSAYGVIIYCVMNLIILPHTRLYSGFHPSFAVLVNGVLALVVCMGIPIALITRRFVGMQDANAKCSLSPHRR